MNPIKAFFLPREELKRFVYLPSLGKDVKKCKYGVILGCKNTSIMYERLQYAVSLYKEGKFDIFVLVGGRGYFGKVSEAHEMERMLQKQFPELHIVNCIIEDKSRNTVQNVENLSEILNCPGKELLLITSGFHLKRALNLFRKRFPGISGVATLENESVNPLLIQFEAFLIACQK